MIRCAEIRGALALRNFNGKSRVSDFVDGGWVCDVRPDTTRYTLCDPQRVPRYSLGGPKTPLTSVP